MSWAKVKLGSFLKVREDRFDPADRRIKGLKRVDKIDFSGNLHLSVSPSKTDMILVKNGDLLISGINVHKGAVIVYEGQEEITATIHYSSYEFDRSKIDIDFLKLFLKSPEFLDSIRDQVPGGIKTEIKPKHLLPLEVEIPDNVEEQRKLVSEFLVVESKNTELSNELTHQLDLIKQLRQAFLREAMQGKLVPQDPNDEPASELLKRIKAEKEKLIREGKLKKDKPLPPIRPEEIPFEIPKGWVWVRFGDVVDIQSNLVAPSKFPNHPHVAPDNIEKGTGKLLTYRTVLEDNVQSGNHYFYVGQLLYSKVRPKLNKVVRVDFEGLCSADMYPLMPRLNRDYLLYCMLSEYFLLEVDRFDNRVKMPKINQNQLSQIPVPVPGFGEQAQIANKLDELLNYCDELGESIEKSQTENKQLLEQLLREAITD